jgi:hypothetical protein
MSVVSIRGRDQASEARALLNCVLRDGESGLTALLLMLEPFTLDRLLVFDADVADLEETEVEPETVLDIRSPKRRAGRLVQAVAVALLLVSAPYALARADQANVVAPLPMSTAQAPQQCCRVCRKGQTVWRQLHQRRKAVQAVDRLRVLGGQWLLTTSATSRWLLYMRLVQGRDSDECLRCPLYPARPLRLPAPHAAPAGSRRCARWTRRSGSSRDRAANRRSTLPSRTCTCAR